MQVNQSPAWTAWNRAVSPSIRKGSTLRNLFNCLNSRMERNPHYISEWGGMGNRTLASPPMGPEGVLPLWTTRQRSCRWAPLSESCPSPWFAKHLESVECSAWTAGAIHTPPSSAPKDMRRTGAKPWDEPLSYRHVTWKGMKWPVGTRRAPRCDWKKTSKRQRSSRTQFFSVNLNGGADLKQLQISHTQQMKKALLNQPIVLALEWCESHKPPLLWQNQIIAKTNQEDLIKEKKQIQKVYSKEAMKIELGLGGFPMPMFWACFV